MDDDLLFSQMNTTVRGGAARRKGFLQFYPPLRNPYKSYLTFSIKSNTLRPLRTHKSRDQISSEVFHNTGFIVGIEMDMILNVNFAREGVHLFCYRFQQIWALLYLAPADSNLYAIA